MRRRTANRTRTAWNRPKPPISVRNARPTGNVTVAPPNTATAEKRRGRAGRPAIRTASVPTTLRRIAKLAEALGNATEPQNGTAKVTTAVRGQRPTLTFQPVPTPARRNVRPVSPTGNVTEQRRNTATAKIRRVPHGNPNTLTFQPVPTPVRRHVMLARQTACVTVRRYSDARTAVAITTRAGRRPTDITLRLRPAPDVRPTECLNVTA